MTCPLCDGTGYKDYRGFGMDPCDHSEQAPADNRAEWDRVALDIGFELIIAMAALELNGAGRSLIGYRFRGRAYLITVGSTLADRPAPGSDIVAPIVN